MRTYDPVFGLRIRNDGWGEGCFGSPRGGRTHSGTDFCAYKGQEVFSMIDGTVDRVVYPYAGKPEWTGLQISNKYVRVYYFYVSPYVDWIGKDIHAGDVVGHAQAISEKYPQNKENGKMLDHVHVQVFLKMYTLKTPSGITYGEELICDPMMFLGREK